ncbi:ornithine cyclodeaminase family protein [Aquimarina hainanensis]|uniref:Ornithine cyclodeaminase family protein n=1 Tax=Aquimarina hainanensis TaxID=1578017 RepID=A0ABW5NC18_9FLAO|nr:ornithine cyclodeaminase family protein [Aquimarina sp. TRL1]QKX03526.1 ornithine cyclodeaminase family protein [Aquimarina sp. TRL1]
MRPDKTLLFNRSSFENLLTSQDYIQAVEKAHILHASHHIIKTDLIHADAPEGEYHIKTGGLLDQTPYYGLKCNGGFFSNSKKFNLPNILGIIYLSNASNAYPLAIFESTTISTMRTAAATTIAAKYLKPDAPIHLGVIGYGNQAAAQLLMLIENIKVETITVSGRNPEKATKFADSLKSKVQHPITTTSIEDLCLNSNIIITCTPSTTPFISRKWIQPGTFIGAVGADSPGKSELDPKLMKTAKIVADIKNQVITVGESQHAIQQNIISPDDIYCELGELLINKKKGRTNAKEIFIYDSTGTAIQDIATAAYIYEKLKNNDTIPSINFFG